MSFVPFTPAGWGFGPTRMKSFLQYRIPLHSLAFGEEFSSAGFACTNTTSASPRRPMSSARPVPCAHQPHVDTRLGLEQRQDVSEKA